MPTTTDVWRLWPTVCHSLVACSLLWTPLWCLQFKVTANRRGELLTGMVWHSNGLAGGKKQHTLNSCSQEAGRAWWFVGGPWSQEARTFVQLLAEARTRSEPLLMRRRMEQAWRLRWFSILSCAAARAFAASLLDLRGGHGVDGHTLPDHEVERDQHHAGLCG